MRRVLERSIDEGSVGGQELLLGLPGELGKVLQRCAKRRDVDRCANSPAADEGRAATKVVGNAAETASPSLRLKVPDRVPEGSQVRPRGGRRAQMALPVRKEAPQLGDELRALMARREPAPPDTHWVAHEQ
jgi:hypothetical protein